MLKVKGLRGGSEFASGAALELFKGVELLSLNAIKNHDCFQTGFLKTFFLSAIKYK